VGHDGQAPGQERDVLLHGEGRLGSGRNGGGQSVSRPRDARLRSKGRRC
jgi:hypothetical protein